MASLLEFFERIVREPNRQMAWGRIPTAHVIGAKQPTSFVANDDYVVVRLASMFLRNSRELWLKLSPLAHASITLNGRTAPRTEAAVVGPAQFGDLATASAERSVVLNQRLSGPAVWRGGDLSIAVGLFAVPKDQAVGALLDTLGKLSALPIPGLASGLEIAGIVKSGVEGLIGLQGTRPVLGVKDAFTDAGVATAGLWAGPCVLAGIAAPLADVDFDRLWVREGRLFEGNSAAALRPLEAHDHLLVSVEKGAERQDWRGLPRLTPHEAAFDAVLREAGLGRPQAEQRLSDGFVDFDADLSAEDELTNPDKDRIRGEVAAELRRRVDRKYGGLFGTETRSVGGIVRVTDPDGFDFLDVADAQPGTFMPIRAGARLFS